MLTQKQRKDTQELIVMLRQHGVSYFKSGDFEMTLEPEEKTVVVSSKDISNKTGNPEKDAEDLLYHSAKRV